MWWKRPTQVREPAYALPTEPVIDLAAERARVRALLSEMVTIDPLLDDALRDCAGPPPHGARLARQVSRLARTVIRAREELAGLAVPEDLRPPIDSHLNYRQQMLEQALLIVFAPKTETIERIRRGLATGLGPAAERFGDVVALTNTALDVSALPEV